METAAVPQLGENIKTYTRTGFQEFMHVLEGQSWEQTCEVSSETRSFETFLSPSWLGVWGLLSYV